MSRTIIGLLIMILLVVLSACSSTSGAVDPEQASPSTMMTEAAPSDQDLERETPQAIQLMLGIFSLEDTDTPITHEQAAEMLILWKALRSLSESDTTAAEELEAVLNQIAEVMTPEQVAAVESMDLDFEDMGRIAEEMGIEFGGAGRFGDITPEMRATMEAARESGQFQGGGPGPGFEGGIPGPGGGPGPGFGGEGISPEARETAIAERGGVRGAQLGLNSVFLDAMIEFLQTKVE